MLRRAHRTKTTSRIGAVSAGALYFGVANIASSAWRGRHRAGEQPGTSV